MMCLALADLTKTTGCDHGIDVVEVDDARGPKPGAGGLAASGIVTNCEQEPVRKMEVEGHKYVFCGGIYVM